MTDRELKEAGTATPASINKRNAEFYSQQTPLPKRLPDGSVKDERYPRFEDPKYPRYRE